jgi:hypothetical protein
VGSDRQQWFIQLQHTDGKTDAADQHLTPRRSAFAHVAAHVLHIRATAGNGHNLGSDRYYELGK